MSSIVIQRQWLAHTSARRTAILNANESGEQEANPLHFISFIRYLE
jgi:hypothetical protein